MKAWLAVLMVVSLFGVIAGSEEPVISPLKGTAVESLLLYLHIGNSIVFNLSAGVLVSIFFWLIVVYWPERNRRNILRNNLERHYAHFKEDIIQILLWAAIGVHDSQLPKKLSDYQQFKTFFSENKNEKWYAALNGLEADQGKVNDILIEMELLANEVAYVLNNVHITEEEVHSFFKRLSAQVYRLRNSSIYTADHVKYLGNFLWGILARWSIIDGQQKDDVIEKMIRKI